MVLSGGKYFQVKIKKNLWNSGTENPGTLVD